MSHVSSPTGVAVHGERSRLLTTLVLAVAMMLGLAFSSFTVLDSQAAPATVSAAPTASMQTESPVQSVSDVAAEANPFVVTIYTFVAPQSAANSGDLKGSNEPVALGAGSGWIYSKDGYVITNAHVVNGADSFTVQYADGAKVDATLVGADAIQDVAVLKLDLAVGQSVPAVAAVGDSSAMRAGDEVVAIGSPLGEFTNSVSDGNIGGLGRSLDTGEGFSLAHLIQHDAEISSGNSGGPLLNMHGEVIGMNVATITNASVGNGASVSGLNFAIDGNTVVERAQQIIDTNASIAYPFVGVQTEQTDQGLVVLDVIPNGPAANAGIQRGDILVGIDATPVSDTASFMDLLIQHQPGDTVSVDVVRDGQSTSVDVVLGERPANPQA